MSSDVWVQVPSRAQGLVLSVQVCQTILQGQAVHQAQFKTGLLPSTLCHIAIHDRAFERRLSRIENEASLMFKSFERYRADRTTAYGNE